MTNGRPQYFGIEFKSPITSAKAIKIISGLLREKVQVWPKPDANLTRGEAAQLIYQQNDMNN